MQQPDTATADVTITIRNGRVEIHGMESHASSVPPSQDGRLGYSVAEVAERVGCSRAFIYERIKRGDLKARSMSGKTLILHADLEQYLSNLPQV